MVLVTSFRTQKIKQNYVGYLNAKLYDLEIVTAFLSNFSFVVKKVLNRLPLPTNFKNK